MIETKSSKTISTCSNKFPLVTVKSVRIIFIAPPMMMDTKNLIDMKNLITRWGRTFTLFYPKSAWRTKTIRIVIFLIESIFSHRWIVPDGFNLISSRTINFFIPVRFSKMSPSAQKYNVAYFLQAWIRLLSMF